MTVAAPIPVRLARLVKIEHTVFALPLSELNAVTAWAGALCYTIQIFFDFSGYSEMALGLARMVGIKLPMNFNSPLKALSIVEYWSRWHITLTRFLTAYIFNPIAMTLARRRAAAGV